MEIELKYLLPTEVSFIDVINSNSISKFVIPNTYNELKMEAHYFDTDDLLLSNSKLSFRVRYENDNLVCTTKFGGGSSNGLHEREEINIEVEKDFLKNPSIEIFKDYPIYEEFKRILNGNILKEIITMEYIRKEIHIQFYDSEAILSLDDGFINSNGVKERIYELEVELCDTNVDNLKEIGEILRKEFNFIPCDKSKLKRGIENLKK